MSAIVESEQTAELKRSAPPHVMLYNANPKTINWERLELKRLQKLNLGPERYSRHFQRFANDEKVAVSFDSATALSPKTTTRTLLGESSKVKKNNSIAPFSTVGKPTCGFFFNRITDNKKKKFGIPPTNLVKWRSFVQ